MTDKELLELAAKAAGKVFVGYHNEFGFLKPANILKDESPYTDYWNPLTDDGDAMRLAVKLGMTVQVGANVFVYSDPDFSDPKTPCVEVCELTNNDPYAATRRAIVRAAADIAEQMK